ncbi:MAG: bifunctional DNA-formamidopyrimidine glycosylase/DNA-(apurinic or apyrimidinic site) lyase [Candidatus Eremiobacteraeota bacterium]|nr:bifunctional DNA-formamidopyrimidine glycosylase/DNA-(apurinic or apyrimidinic site) lyase [Candidatus Eremiobacteraeota bacterium]
MPELPEVETIARGLNRLLSGCGIEDLTVSWPRTVHSASLPLGDLVGDRIEAVSRAGKLIVLELRSGRRLAVHLRMTGRLLVTDAGTQVPYSKVVVSLGSGRALVFADARKFGRVRLFVGDVKQTLGIGIDPFDASLDDVALKALFAGKRTPVKALLLDQRRIAGVGNIYAAEALFYAGVRPRRQAKSLSRRERIELLRALRAVLRRAIRHRGSSVDDYVDAEGKRGGFQKHLAVYGRTGSPCPNCRALVRRIVVAQRSTFYCPACQQ